MFFLFYANKCQPETQILIVFVVVKKIWSLTNIEMGQKIWKIYKHFFYIFSNPFLSAYSVCLLHLQFQDKFFSCVWNV